MFVPTWLLLAIGLSWLAAIAWAVQVARRRNPLPFPDPGSRIFSAASADAKGAVVELLARHGLRERFRADGPGVLRSILWDGTIINCSSPEIVARLGGAHACIGLVARDPVAAAEAAAGFLRARGFAASVVRDVEPGLPIAFVVSDALTGSVINFRPHLLRMPRPRPPGERGR